MSRKAASPHEKYITFKQAYTTINECMKVANYIAAYVIAFSVIEDRISAMYIVWHRVKIGSEPSTKVIRSGFASKVRALQSAKEIDPKDAFLFLEEAKERNKLLHDAMWNLNVFSLEVAERVISLAKLIDKIRKSQKKILGQ